MAMVKSIQGSLGWFSLSVFSLFASFVLLVKAERVSEETFYTSSFLHSYAVDVFESALTVKK